MSPNKKIDPETFRIECLTLEPGQTEDFDAPEVVRQFDVPALATRFMMEREDGAFLLLRQHGASIINVTCSYPTADEA